MGQVLGCVRHSDDGWEGDARTQALRERIEELEFELEDIRNTVAGLGPWGLKVEPAAVRIMHLVSQSAPRVVSYDYLCVHVHGWERDTDKRTIVVQVCRLRRQLRRLGLTLETERTVGYFVSKTDAEKWRRWSRLRNAGEPPAADYPLRIAEASYDR